MKPNPNEIEIPCSVNADDGSFGDLIATLRAIGVPHSIVTRPDCGGLASAPLNYTVWIPRAWAQDVAGIIDELWLGAPGTVKTLARICPCCETPIDPEELDCPQCGVLLRCLGFSGIVEDWLKQFVQEHGLPQS